MSIFDYFHKPEDPKEPHSATGQSTRSLLAAFAANVEADKHQYPEDAADIERIYTTLRGKYKRSALAMPGREANAAASFFLSEDKLRAYACIFPPQNGGADVNVEGFLSRMGYEGITRGVLQEEIRRRISARDYLHIFPIAAGDPPRDGVDGQVEDLYARLPPPNFTVGDEGTVDFSEAGFVAAVGKGDMICRVVPPVEGHEGMDVTGQTIPCRIGLPAHLPQGENTRISAGGMALEAEIAGILCCQDEVFRVYPARLVDGGLSGGDVPLHIRGDIFILGDLSEGVVLEATGNIFIGGVVRDARVESTQGSIRVQGGVAGVEGETTLRAAGQVQSPTIVNATVDAGGNVFAQSIDNSSIVSGGSVNALAGEGSIVGGYIQAMHRVVCHRLGRDSGPRCQVMVGCDPQIVAEWEQNHEAAAETQKVLDTLWENVTTLRRTEAWLNEEQKSVLRQLLEQRTLYEKKRDSLKKEREVLREQMKAARSGRVKCHELFPALEVRLGERKAEVKSHEYECDIHLREDNAVLLR